MTIDTIIRAVQKKLGVGVDGNAGPATWNAIYEAVVGKAAPAATAPATVAATKVDDRSEKTIATLLPEVHPYARALVERAAAVGIQIKIINGMRTYQQQDDLYAQGRTKPGAKVTNAKGGYSNHNFGIAFDIGVFVGTKYMPESPSYKAVGAIGMAIGLEWGGNWKTFKDMPHYQLRPKWAANMSEKDMLTELRARKASGKGVYA